MLAVFIIGETGAYYKQKIENLSKTPARKGLTNDTENDTIKESTLQGDGYEVQDSDY